jgi:hypothetical protein
MDARRQDPQGHGRNFDEKLALEIPGIDKLKQTVEAS